MEDIISEILETILEAVLKSVKVPKIIKYLFIIVICGAVVTLGMFMGLSSDIAPEGRACGFILAVLFMVLGVFLIFETHRK